MITSQKKILLIFLLFVFLPVLVCAGGQKEDPVASAQALMEERRWDEAILILKEMMASNPSRFDEGQNVIQKIMYNKRIYNDYFQKLVDAYVAGDLELAYQIIGEMEAQDPNPNPTTRELIIEARATAGVIATKNRFDAIMAEAETAINEERYYDAIEIYLGGYNIARDLFGDLALGNVVEERVDSQNQRIIELSRNIISLEEQISDAIETAQGLLPPAVNNPQSLDDFRTDLAEINGILNTVLSDYREIVELSIDLLIYHDFLQENNDLEKDIYHLKYIAYLYTGRPSALEYEGISGVIDIMTEQVIGPMESITFNINQDLYGGTVSAFRSRNYSQTRELIESLNLTLDFYITAQRSWPLRTVLDTQTGELWKNSLRDYDTVVGQSAYIQTLKGLTGAYDETAEIGIEYSDITAFAHTVTEIEEFDVRRAELSRLITRLESVNPDDGIPVLDPLVENQNAEQAVLQFREDKDTLLAEMTTGDIRLAGFKLQRVIESYSDQLRQNREQINESIAQLEGYRTEDEDGEYFYRNPRDAKDELLSQEDENQEINQEIEEFIAEFTDNPGYVVQNEAIQQQLNELEELQDDIGQWSGEIAGHIEQADEYLFQAQRFRQEGNDYIQEARSLLARNEFERARQRVEDAAGRYDESLEYQDDETIRARRDTEIPELYDEIINQQKQAVVQEVRTLINQGRSYYSQGEFLDAESVLLRAQARYSEVSNESDQEVEYWLELAQTALSVNSGREILPVDPLYPEMTQLLNLAKADYNEAKKALDAGNRTRGNALLDQAETRILTVQQPFPINKEAGLLALKILQLRNPQEFDAAFAERFNNARSMVRQGGAQAQEGYIELLDLQAIRPEYRGMDQAIYQAEVAIGIRIPPPDPAKLRRARELYAEALNIVQSNATTQYQIALNALNEALTLNPDYIEAIRLKDRIQSSSAIEGKTVIFSPQDQRLYNEAVDAYQNGLYREAQLIVDRLLEKKDNQRNSDLLELNERIQSRL